MTPASRSAPLRSSIPSKVTSNRGPCGRTERTVNSRPCSSKTTAPGTQRSGLSERFSTATSPWTPWALVIRPTVTAGSSTSVLEIDAGGEALARRGCADDGADRLGGAAAPADHLAELTRADRDVIRRSPLVEGLGHLGGVGILDELTTQELDELLHLRPLRSPWRRRQVSRPPQPRWVSRPRPALQHRWARARRRLPQPARASPRPGTPRLPWPGPSSRPSP